MPEHERKEILESLTAVDEVVLTDHKLGEEDKSVCRSLELIKPHIFANGGDRKSDNIPEYQICEQLGINMAFNVGFGGKVQSSSWLVNKASKND